MATISELDGYIENAKTEIEACKNLKAVLGDIDSDILNCVKDLNYVSSKMAAGLIIEGKPADDGVILKRAEILSGYQSAQLKNCDDAATNRISILEADINYWESEKETIRVKLSTLWNNIKNSNKKEGE